ncbi:hypothetical protein MIR68_002854 [Amoeboaphelidium protococcarum]|nr:hypothetical protein MIR68_002854 [Amoeboaphelidium protococcarum]
MNKVPLKLNVYQPMDFLQVDLAFDVRFAIEHVSSGANTVNLNVCNVCTYFGIDAHGNQSVLANISDIQCRIESTAQIQSFKQIDLTPTLIKN